MLRIIIITVLLLVFKSSAYALYFKNISISDGLPNNTVKCFAQDGQGFLWIGTFNGLTRYDGFKFEVFRHNDSNINTLANSHVESMLYDGRGGLWLGLKEGIDHFSIVSQTVSHCTYIPRKGASPQPIRGYVWQIVRSAGRLWAINEHGSLFYKKDDASLTWHVLPQRYGRNKAIIDIDGKYMAMLTTNSLMLIDGKSLAVKAKYKIKNRIDRDALCNLYYSHIQQLLFVGQGYGYGSQAYHVSKRGFKQADIKLPPNLKAVTDYNGQTYFATDGQGLKVISDHGVVSAKVENNYIMASAIHSLFVDNNDNLWMGTYRDGVCFYTPRFNVFKSLQFAGLYAVSSVYEHGGKVYAGTDGGGLMVYDISSGNIKTLNTSNSGIPCNNVLSIVADSKYVWMGMYGKGFYRYNIRTGAFTKIKIPPYNGEQHNPYVFWNLKDDGRGHIIICGRHIYAYNKANGTVYPLTGLDDAQTLSTYIHGRDLWVSSNKGFFQIDLQTFRVTGKLTGRELRNVRTFCVVGRKLYWAKEYGDICVLDIDTKKITSLSSFLSLTERNVSVMSITDDGRGRLWLGTDRGLYKYDIESHTAMWYDEHDNLLQSQFCLNSSFRNGMMIYLGTVRGLVYFDENELALADNDNMAYIEKLYLTNSHDVLTLSDSSAKRLELAYDQNFFTIRFAIPDLITARKLLVKYKLEGFDNGWTMVSSIREATYTNVPPGQYTFIIKTMNADGSWSKKESRLSIIVDEPWYSTWWAWLIWILLIAAIVYAIFQYYLHEVQMKHELARKDMEKQHVAEQKELEKRILEKTNEDKLNFFTDITHELRTPMFLITAPLEELMASPQRPVPVPYSYIKSMYRNAIRLTKLVSNILDIRKMGDVAMSFKPQRCDMVRLLKKLSLDYRTLCQQKNIRYGFYTTLDSLTAEVDTGKFELILSNLVANAYKYTNDGGRITVSLLADDNTMTITVVDTGSGIESSEIGKIFDRYYRATGDTEQTGNGIGLASVKNMVELHGGSICAKSDGKGKGSTFTLVLPLRQDMASAIPSSVTVEETEEKDDDGGEKRIQLPTATQAILVIDDNAETVKLLERCLSEEYKIFKAADGEEGLRMTVEEMPDLIICDVMMPRMNGIEFLEKVKNDGRLQHIPVIMFTAKTLDEDKIEAYSCGADAYVTKPVSIRYLKARIKALLRCNIITAKGVSGSTSPSPHYSKTDQKFILSCQELIEKHLDNPDFNVATLASELGMSHSALYKKIKTITGKTAVDMLVSYRIFRAVQMMKDGETNVTHIAEMCGFYDLRSFRAAFKSRMNTTPKLFMQQL